MKLDELIEHLDYKDLINFKNVEISGISYNSKTTKNGDIFVCLTGEYTDGHEYAKDAIENGFLNTYKYIPIVLSFNENDMITI